jgi:hypothetical protein
MNADAITTEKLSELTSALNRASADIHRLHIASIDGDVTPKFVAKEIERILVEIKPPDPMKTTTESSFPLWDETIGLTSYQTGHAYNSLRNRAIKLEMELRRIAASEAVSDEIKISIHSAIK